MTSASNRVWPVLPIRSKKSQKRLILVSIAVSRVLHWRTPLVETTVNLYQYETPKRKVQQMSGFWAVVKGSLIGAAVSSRAAPKNGQLGKREGGLTDSETGSEGGWVRVAAHMDSNLTNIDMQFH